MSVQACISFFETFSTNSAVTTNSAVATTAAATDCTLNVRSIVDYFEMIATPATTTTTTTAASNNTSINANTTVAMTTMMTVAQTRTPVDSRVIAPLADVPPTADGQASTLPVDILAGHDGLTESLTEMAVAANEDPAAQQVSTSTLLPFDQSTQHEDHKEQEPITPEDAEAAWFMEYVERIWYGDLNHLSYDYQWHQTHMTPADAIPIREQRKLHTPTDDEDRDNSMVDPAAHWTPADSPFPFDSPTEVEGHDEPVTDTLKDAEAAEAAQLMERVQRIWHGDLRHL
ncbi:hypothetical protein BBJ29_010142, partial [Phytophthora kernoviae]